MTEHSLKSLYRKLVDIGQAADDLCRRYPRHQVAGKEGNLTSVYAAARDLAYVIEHTIRNASPALLDRIARG
jgi:hypothetical protein